MSDKGFIWDPSNCECECDKLVNIWTMKTVKAEKK